MLANKQGRTNMLANKHVGEQIACYQYTPYCKFSTAVHYSYKRVSTVMRMSNVHVMQHAIASDFSYKFNEKLLRIILLSFDIFNSFQTRMR